MNPQNRRLLVILSILLVLGFLVTSLASFYVSRTSLRSQIYESALPLTSDNIYSEIQRDLLVPIYISSVMATDTFLRDWVLNGEHDPDRITRYLKDIQQKYHTFTSFFVSEKTWNYYQSEGILKKVDPAEPRDIWYFRVRDMDEPYEINIDPDMANYDTMTIFVNYRVLDYDGNFIGATGVGLSVTSVKSLIESYQRKYGRNVYFIDDSGTVTMHGVSFPSHISNIRDVPDLSARAGDILSQDTLSLEYGRDGETYYLNTRYIPEFGWYLCVEQASGTVMRSIINTLLANLVICLVITFVVLSITYYTVTSYNRRIEHMATTDKLTGLYNRQSFDIILDQTLREYRRSGERFSVVWMDIDKFKFINDTYGHMAGDRILMVLAGCISRNRRASDVSCRWGGDEFILLLRDCTADNARAMAEDICATSRDSIVDYEGDTLSVTVSLGVAEFTPEDTKTTLLKRADTALYSAKKQGGDCVETG